MKLKSVNHFKRNFLGIIFALPLTLLAQWDFGDQISSDTFGNAVCDFYEESSGEDSLIYYIEINCADNFKRKGIFYRRFYLKKGLDTFILQIQNLISISDSFKTNAVSSQMYPEYKVPVDAMVTRGKFEYFEFFQSKSCKISLNLNETLEMLLWFEAKKSEAQRMQKKK